MSGLDSVPHAGLAFYVAQFSYGTGIAPWHYQDPISKTPTYFPGDGNKQDLFIHKSM